MTILQYLAVLIIIILPTSAHASGLNPKSCLDADISYRENGQYRQEKIEQCVKDLDTSIQKFSYAILKHVPALSPTELEWYNSEINSDSGERLINAQHSDIGIRQQYRVWAETLKILSSSFEEIIDGEDKSLSGRIMYFSQALSVVIDMINPDKLEVLLKNQSLSIELSNFLDCKNACNVKDRLTGNFEFLGGASIFLHLIQFDASQIRMKEIEKQ